MVANCEPVSWQHSTLSCFAQLCLKRLDEGQLGSMSSSIYLVNLSYLSVRILEYHYLCYGSALDKLLET